MITGKKAVMAGDDNQLSLKVLEWILCLQKCASGVVYAIGVLITIADQECDID
ncbi:hypothetical protein [Parageobacillus thermoglucosidasius]|mgnify:CR=1 FL=1|uniref:Uncharacterized protein n=1 Tax=Parageobacillus thermoglucosidasius TaxID=1426 RepID=A0AB38QUG8_PARTM|nr:hypothetical protein [Parageobacillus thermoglucosidasius]UOE74746.1 hypothetical protein IMI45_10155 [Parageobacillus thermoglucosidasius]